MFQKLKLELSIHVQRIVRFDRFILFSIFYFFFHLSSILCFIPYCAARAFLVVEAFISLRHVPEGVYQVVQWTSYIPHL